MKVAIIHACGHEVEYTFSQAEKYHRANETKMIGLVLDRCSACPPASSIGEEEPLGEPFTLPCWTGCGTHVETDNMLPVFCSDVCRERYIELSAQADERIKNLSFDTHLPDTLLQSYAHLSAMVPIEIERLLRYGGPTEYDIEHTRDLMRKHVVEKGAGHAVIYLDKGQTAIEISLLTQSLAIMAFAPGGVNYCNLRFDVGAQVAKAAKQRDQDVEAFFALWEPFKQAMDREERESRLLEDVTQEEMTRLRVLEDELAKALWRNDSVQAALLEAEMDGILLAPQPVPVAPIEQAVQRELWESA